MADSLLARSQWFNSSNRTIAPLLLELFRIYAEDVTERANIAAINEIRKSFGADAAALFYVEGGAEYHICLAGLDFPIALAEPRWRANVEAHTAEDEVTRFGPWSMPGIEKSITFWISARLYQIDDEGGYVFLGRNSGPWQKVQSDSMMELKRAMTPVIMMRLERGISEYRRSEAEKRLAASEMRLRSLFDGLRDMVYTVDMADTITEVSLSTCSMLGYESKQDLVGRQYRSLLAAPEDRIHFLDKIREDGFIDDYEVVLKRRDGSTIFCLETAHARKDDSGGIIEIQGIVKDISDRIRNERELWKMNLELADSNLKLQKTQQLMVQHEKMASIGQLAAGVAHEINNPLGFLISNNTTLEKNARKLQEAWAQTWALEGASLVGAELSSRIERLFSQTFEIFAESRDGFERIQNIVGNLKNFSRLDQHQSLAEFDVNAGIESTLVVAWNEIKYVAEVHKKLDPLPLVRCNANEINQVFLNIMVNAAQAIAEQKKSDKGILDIKTVQHGENVIIAIADDGPGIPEAIQNKIFDPFFTTKAPGKGTGLGLSISYDIIVSKHGGALWVESTQGVGTTFFISLPIAGPGSHPE